MGLWIGMNYQGKGWGCLQEVGSIGCAAHGISYGVTGLPMVGAFWNKGRIGVGFVKWDNLGGVVW